MSVSDNTSHTEWNAKKYSDEAEYVSILGNSVFELLGAQPGERILDLGCGDGRLTRQIKETGAEVIGVDGSADMVETACAAGLDARLMDGHALTFRNEFDAVFSNAALHWMREPDLVIQGVANSLIPGGRFVGECGGFGNVAAITSVIYGILAENGFDADEGNPWYYPTVEEYTQKLEAAGFKVQAMELIWRPTPIPQGMRAWLDMFCQSLFNPTGDKADELKDKVVEALRFSLYDEKQGWIADHVRLRFVAFLE